MLDFDAILPAPLPQELGGSYAGRGRTRSWARSEAYANAACDLHAGATRAGRQGVEEGAASTFGKRSVYNSASLEHCNRPVEGRRVLQKIAVQNHEVGKLAVRDCANLIDVPRASAALRVAAVRIADGDNPARRSTSIS